MSELGITGKRVRKKPKYLRDDEGDDDEEPESKASKSSKPKKQKKEKEKTKKSKSKKVSKKEKLSEDSPKPIKLKIKLGGRSSSTSHASTPKELDESTRDSFPVTEDSDDVDIEGETTQANDNLSVPEPEEFLEYNMSDEEDDVPSKPAKADDDDTSDEEREWLEAVESGDIEEYEKKKNERNPAILTARQKRLLHGEEEGQLMELPSQRKSKQPMTEEQIDMKKQRAVKRKIQAQEKSEKAKKQTVDRLLKKTDSALAKAKGSKTAGNLRPHIRHIMNREMISLSLPADVPFPLQPQTISRAPKPIRCGVSGCKNLKKYNCSKTNIPLCSLQCYKKNINKQNTGSRKQQAVT